VAPADALRARAAEYELLGAWYEERAPIDRESGPAAIGFVVVAIVLREIAEVLDGLEGEFEAA
jgi:hypothetical protein